VEPVAVDFTLELRPLPDGQEAGDAVYRFELQTDPDGSHQYSVSDDANFSGIEPGHYRWHIQFDWTDPSLLHHYIFTTRWGGGSDQQRTHTFLPSHAIDQQASSHSYIGEAFEVTVNEEFEGFTLEFVEPATVYFRLELRSQSDDEDTGDAVYRFELPTDENGVYQYRVRAGSNFSHVNPGRYLWHLQFDWADSSVPHDFMLTTRWEGGSDPQRSHTFLPSHATVDIAPPDEQVSNQPYVGEPFEVADNEAFEGFTLEIAEPAAVDFTLELRPQPDGQEAGDAVHQFELQTDPNGRHQYSVSDDENFSGIEPGPYRWYIQFDWTDPSAPHDFTFATHWEGRSVEFDPQPSHTFLSAFTTIDYALLDDQGFEATLNPLSDNHYSNIIIPHIRENIDSITVSA
jgi:hypothetical protein